MAKPNTIGERIILLKDLKLDITDSEFADRLGVARYTVSRWRNEGINPRRGLMPHIAEVLGVRLADLESVENIDELAVREIRSPYRLPKDEPAPMLIETYERVRSSGRAENEYARGEPRPYQLPLALPSLEDKILVTLRFDLPSIGLHFGDEIVFDANPSLKMNSLMLVRHRGIVRLAFVLTSESGLPVWAPIGPLEPKELYLLGSARPLATAIAVCSLYTFGPNISYNQGAPLQFALSTSAAAILNDRPVHKQ